MIGAKAIALRVHDPLLHARQGAANTARAIFRGQTPIGHGTGFGQAIALGNSYAKLVKEFVGHAGWKRLAATDGVAQHSQMLRAPTFLRGQRVIHGWNGHEDRGLMVLAQFKNFSRHKLGGVDGFGGDGQREQCENGQSERMKLRQHAKQNIFAREGGPVHNLINVGGKISATQHHALGLAAGSTGVQQHGKFIFSTALGAAHRRKTFERHVLHHERLHGRGWTTNKFKHGLHRHHAINARVAADIFQVIARQ